MKKYIEKKNGIIYQIEEEEFYGIISRKIVPIGTYEEEEIIEEEITEELPKKKRQKKTEIISQSFSFIILFNIYH